MFSKYAENGVGYVEFSVGFGDLIERPWVFKHLITIAEEFENKDSNRVVSRFLIGFNRSASPSLRDKIYKPVLKADAETKNNDLYRKFKEKNSIKACFDLDSLKPTLKELTENFRTTAEEIRCDSDCYQTYIDQLKKLKEIFLNPIKELEKEQISKKKY